MKLSAIVLKVNLRRVAFLIHKNSKREVAELDSQKREISSVVALLGEEVSVKKQELKNATNEKNWQKKLHRKQTRRELQHNRRKRYYLQVIRI